MSTSCCYSELIYEITERIPSRPHIRPVSARLIQEIERMLVKEVEENLERNSDHLDRTYFDLALNYALFGNVETTTDQVYASIIRNQIEKERKAIGYLRSKPAYYKKIYKSLVIDPKPKTNKEASRFLKQK